MEYVGIWETDEGLCALARRCLPQALRGKVRLLSWDKPQEPRGVDVSLLVLSPRAALWRGLDGLRPCPRLLLPDPAGPVAELLHAEMAVSYGVSPRDTLTVSSLGEDRMVLALQRELITLPGTLVDRQEFVLPRPAKVPPLILLACTGILLMLGVPPEEIRIPQAREEFLPTGS